MNREIKFRAWDPFHNKMITDFDGYFLDCQNGVFTIGNIDDNNDWIDMEIMQFTGLKDKNGKEIYEGDIIKKRGMKNKSVIFRKGCFKLLEDTGKVEWTNNLENETTHYIEVIGNIYENKDLLP